MAPAANENIPPKTISVVSGSADKPQRCILSTPSNTLKNITLKKETTGCSKSKSKHINVSKVANNIITANIGKKLSSPIFPLMHVQR